MSKKSKSEVIKTLLVQKEIFGDDLFTKRSGTAKPKPEPAKTNSIREKRQEYTAPPAPVKTGTISATAFQSTTLSAFQTGIQDCQLCGLGKTRNKFVFGTGSHTADIMLIGEGPGAEEDAKGEPFVGRAGQLLTDILKAIQLSRESVYIANIVKCRPPGNRTPTPAEIETCIPFLHRQIELVNPKYILCLGATAAVGLLGKKESLGKMRLQIFDFNGRQVVVTYHPAALLRNPAWKKDCWADVQFFRDLWTKQSS